MSDENNNDDGGQVAPPTPAANQVPVSVLEIERRKRQQADAALKAAQEKLAALEAEGSKVEALSSDLEKMKNDLAAERAKSLRQRVAAEAGLPPELAGRLSGDDLEALQADAAQLVELVKKPEPPAAPPRRMPVLPAAGGGGDAVPVTIKQLNNAEWRLNNPDKVVEAAEMGIFPTN